ncbi:MAG: RsmB/NOP family class I SAM-dependent RNA methyltransferase [Deltaproteobacteria bacterium]|nr:RsmB/NOP family class I SAM-dependent RNA methyltransferase [Deltaproteobacteria bacterium]
MKPLRPTADPRADAAVVLARAITGSARSTDLLLEFERAYPAGRERDAALLHELVLGVLRHRAACQTFVTPLLRKPLDDSPPPVREVLLCMAYQAVFLERVPAHARVSASVAAVRRVAGDRYAGFVNAVGRGIERAVEAGDPLAPLPPEVRHSIPRHLLRRIAAVHGGPPDEDVLARMSDRATLALRANRAAATPDEVTAALVAAGLGARRSAIAPDGVVVEHGRLASAVAAGVVPRLAVPQDEASQLVVAALAPQPGERVLDLCAGGGVKTSQIEAATGAAATAVDLDGARLERASDLCRRMGLPSPEAIASDAASLPAEMDGHADAVLLDAPCTGIGTARRRPEVRYVRREPDYTRAAEVQVALLRRACSLPRPGGRLVYAVCSFAPEEGPGVVARVLAERTDVAVEPAPIPGPWLRRDGTVLTLPWRDGCDGFFVACLRRL